MLPLGIILILLAAATLAAALLGGSSDPATFDLGIFEVQTNTLGVFLIGAATVLLLVVGLWLTRSGTRRANRHRHEKRELNRLSEKLEAREADRQAGDSTSTRSDTAPPEDTQTDR